MDESDIVRGLERIGNLDPDIEQRVSGSAPLSGEMRVQSLAFDKLHHDEVKAIGFFNGVNGNDVWMVQRGG